MEVPPPMQGGVNLKAFFSKELGRLNDDNVQVHQVT